MMTASTQVLCAHGGQGKPTVPNPRVKVMGQPTTLQTPPWVIAGCPFVVAGAPVPCVTATWVVGSVRVTSMGQPLLLVDSKAICVPNGTPVNVIPAQTRVKAT